MKANTRKASPLKQFAVRLNPDQYEKLGWLAAERGVQRSDMLRQIVADAVKGARRPADAKSRELQASDAEWRAWQDMAAQTGHTLDEIVRTALNRMTRNVFGTAPKLRDGRMAWKSPE